ncbi:hypothetical protein GCM10010975_08500 [Comamonas phosphati]|nr:hypothetical protein GCM10010975_08500 [Comamonas phosphati]
MAELQPRIALLIDADNAPAEKIDEILTELSTFGVIDIRRVYGNWTKHALIGWQNKLLEYALRPMQQFDYSKHKNATDMAMTVDAMELLYTEKPNAFGIVSSDADFTPLVMHLRFKGAAVYGFGAAQTPKPFVNACSRFLYLEALGEDAVLEPGAENAAAAARPAAAAGGPPQEGRNGAPSNGLADKPAATGAAVGPAEGACLRVPRSQLRQDTGLMSLLRSAVNATQDEDGWARVGAVGTQIGNKASFDARNYGYATLTKLLVATQAFDLRDEGTSRVAVRDKRAAKARSGN